MGVLMLCSLIIPVVLLLVDVVFVYVSVLVL